MLLIALSFVGEIRMLLYTETTVIPEWFKLFHKLEYVYVAQLL